jgi:hypothetical protein
VPSGFPSGDLNQPRMGGDNAKYITGAEQQQTPEPAIMNTLSDATAVIVAIEQVTTRS